MYIHLEGLDLAGKSTVRKRLKKRIPDFAERHNTLLEHNPIYDKADDFRKNYRKNYSGSDGLSEELIGMLYYAALRVDLDEYISPLQPTIQDSTIILRSIVFHFAAGNKELARRFENLLPGHPQFGKSFVLVASRETRLHRLEQRISRKNDAPDDYIVRDDYPRFKAMEEHLIELAKHYFNAEIIETEHLETPDISDQIIESIIGQASIPSTMNRSPLRQELWQKAASLAAKCHRYQLRKDEQTPYLSHPLRVALTLANLFHVDDPVVLAAALLHDVIEDTTGDFDDIEACCGTEVALLVAALTKDSRLREEDRELAYQKQMESADWRVRLIKLADIYDNLCDVRQTGVRMGAGRWAAWIQQAVVDDIRFKQPLSFLKQLQEE